MSPPNLTDAACRDLPAHWWHPDEGKHATRAYAAARQICHACPVRTECLAWAMSVEVNCRSGRHGMYGGLTPEERASLGRRTA